MSTEHITNTEAAQQELREIALLLREYAESEDLSINGLISQHKELGSDKTFGSICKGDFTGLKLESWLEAYRAVRDRIAPGNEADPLYDDLTTTKRVRSAVTRLKLSRTLAKLVIIKGYTGSGKTSALRIIREKYNAMSASTQVYAMEASAGWSDRPTAMLGEMLTALGHDAGARNATTRLNRLLEAVGERSIMVTLDEVHDLGPRCLRVLKTLLNRTAVKLVIACHPRLWRELEREASDDLSQLTGNRLLSVVDLGTLAVEDVASVLTKRLRPGLNGDTPEAAKIIAEAAIGHGNLAFNREVIVRLQKQARTSGTLTLEDVKKAVRKELHARRPEAAKLAA